MLNSLSPNDHERLSRFAALGTMAIAAGVCLYLLVRIVWLVLPSGGGADVNPAPASAPVAAGAQLSVAKWHLFGNPQALPPASNAALNTILKLGLHGTLALPDPRDERAIAIIANEQGVEGSYRIGASVVPGAKLAEVYADHVMLDHDGVAETLPMPRPEQHAAPERNPQRPNAAAAPTAVLPSAIARPAPAAASAPAAAAAPRIEPQELARQIRPVFADGRIVGADISGADATLLARVGLKSSDVVTAINGTPLTSVSNPQALMDQLQNSSSVQVTVQRDGKPATLTLSLH